jgi:hypothetical protein
MVREIIAAIARIDVVNVQVDGPVEVRNSDGTILYDFTITICQDDNVDSGSAETDLEERLNGGEDGDMEVEQVNPSGSTENATGGSQNSSASALVATLATIVAAAFF